jgi:hypothetical protein
MMRHSAVDKRGVKNGVTSHFSALGPSTVCKFNTKEVYLFFTQNVRIREIFIKRFVLVYGII